MHLSELVKDTAYEESCEAAQRRSEDDEGSEKGTTYEEIDVPVMPLRTLTHSDMWVVDSRELGPTTNVGLYIFGPKGARTNYIIPWGAQVRGHEQGAWRWFGEKAYLPMRAAGRRVVFPAAEIAVPECKVERRVAVKKTYGALGDEKAQTAVSQRRRRRRSSGWPTLGF